MEAIHKIRTRLASGIAIPLSQRAFKIEFFRKTQQEHKVHFNGIQKLLETFPEYRKYYSDELAEDFSGCIAFLDFLYDRIGAEYLPAREPQLRSHLSKLKSRTKDPKRRATIETEIAMSDLRSGVVERALSLLNFEDEQIRSQTEKEMEDFELIYGARAPLLKNRDIWRHIPGDLRGQSLVWFYERRKEIVSAKDILHIAPELALQNWFAEHSKSLKSQYLTLDPFRNAVDLKEDLTELSVEDSTFDHIICHRVLEHVVDDFKALRELYRILKPGGTLSISVPQSVQRAETNEWIIPDLSHDGHLRQYGRDFEARLQSSGFKTSLQDDLLKKSLDEHQKDLTYPLRFYLAEK